MSAGSALRTFLRAKGRLFEVRDAVSLGRSSRCDLVLEDELASREHCRVTVDGDRVHLHDLGSRNGVRVNGARVHGSIELHHADVIGVGASHVVVLRHHAEPRRGRGSDVRTQPAGPDEAVTWHGLLPSFVAAARDALEEGDEVAAQVACRTAFVALRTALAAGAEATEAVVELSELGLDVAAQCQDGYWIDQVLALHLVAGVPMREPVALRIAHLAEAIAPPADELDDYLAASARIEGLSGRARAYLAAAYCLRAEVAAEAETTAAAPSEGAHEEARLALRAAILAQLQHQASPPATAAPWELLTESAWCLVDHFDEHGRRYVVACRNAPGAATTKLTAQERRIAVLLADGTANKVIAYELGLSTPRVANIVSSIKEKLGVRSRSEAVTLLRWAIAAGRAR